MNNSELIGQSTTVHQHNASEKTSFWGKMIDYFFHSLMYDTKDGSAICKHCGKKIYLPKSYIHWNLKGHFFFDLFIIVYISRYLSLLLLDWGVIGNEQLLPIVILVISTVIMFLYFRIVHCVALTKPWEELGQDNIAQSSPNNSEQSYAEQYTLMRSMTYSQWWYYILLLHFCVTHTP